MKERFGRPELARSAPIEMAAARFQFSLIELMIAVAFVACCLSPWTLCLMAIVVHVFPWIWTWRRLDEWETGPTTRLTRFGKFVSSWVLYNWLGAVPLLALARLSPFVLVFGLLSVAGVTVLGGVWLTSFAIAMLREARARRATRAGASAE
jgi:hypothetical protein